MTKTVRTHAAYLSWKTAWRIRCCPPDTLLFGGNTEELQAHLDHCPWCRQERKQQLSENCSFPALSTFKKADKPAWPDAMARPQKANENPNCGSTTLSRKFSDKRPLPGELWALKQELGGWGPKKRYYTPPLVVIIAVYEDCVEVSQSYGDCTMAGIDDLRFELPRSGFCQPWNRYTLRKEDFDTCYGTVIPSTGLITSTADEYQTQQIEPGSLLWFFRQMEVETGFFFSSKAVRPLLAQYENTVQETAVQLSDLGLPVPDKLPATVNDLLLSTGIPDNLLPLAASDKLETTEYCLNFLFENDRLTAVNVTGMNITLWQREGQLLHVSGHFTENPSENSTILFGLKTKNHFFDPLPGEFGAEGDFFWALFQIGENDIEQGEYVVRIITRKE
ncbi:hypothetical protein [Desulfomarina sp.]